MGAIYIYTADLNLGTHRFHFPLDNTFLQEYGGEYAPKGEFKAELELCKSETNITANAHITGTAHLICDRSMQPFQHAIDINKNIFFNYGEVGTEHSDDLIFIDRKVPKIDAGQLFYEFIGLAIPMKKLHPDFQDEEDDMTTEQLVYSSSSDDIENEEQTNPIWEALKQKQTSLYGTPKTQNIKNKKR